LPPTGSAVSGTPVSCARICWVRSASVALCSVGSASASSYALVWSDCVPPSTAASAWIATRTTLFLGCCAVRVDPPVCVWKRRRHAASPAWKRSFMSRAHSLRAARNLATSSNRSVNDAKKNETRGASWFTSSPDATARRRYSSPFANVNASSSTAVTFANGLEYLRRAVASGLDVNQLAPRVSFFFASFTDLFEEVAKFRAARRLWARLMKDRFQAGDAACRLRFHTQTGGSTLTAQQPK